MAKRMMDESVTAIQYQATSKGLGSDAQASGKSVLGETKRVCRRSSDLEQHMYSEI